MRSLPGIAIMLGLGGLIPFLACGFAAASLQGDWATRALLGLEAYAALILAFLGGVHWGIGLELGAAQTVAASRARFGLGVVPSLVGWGALMVTFFGLPLVGLGILAAGFIGVVIVEARGSRAGLLPGGYMALRWLLSIVVILVLVSVLIVLSFGGRIVT